jgi:N-acetylglucosaminyldiphosphoundecaprenol N-acetyl-beta-D-mannosaminyltransferase
MKQVDLLGVRIDDVTTDEVLQSIDRYVTEPQLRLICTPNADHVVKAWHDDEFRSIINGCDLAIPDGMAVIYGSRLLGTPLGGNVAGRLLVPRLCERAATTGYRIFLFGAAPGVAAEAARKLTSDYSGLQIAGTFSPPLGFERDSDANEHALSVVNAARADILLVALGAPKQEKWIVANRQRISASVAIGVGGTFDILAGRVREAPEWATRIGAEWLFRMLQEPGRLGRRYLIDDQEFVRATLGYWVRRNLRRPVSRAMGK